MNARLASLLLIIYFYLYLQATIDGKNIYVETTYARLRTKINKNVILKVHLVFLMWLKSFGVANVKSTSNKVMSLNS